MYAGGMSQRDIEGALEKALGQFVVSKSAVRDLTERLTLEYDTTWNVTGCRAHDVPQLYGHQKLQHVITRFTFRKIPLA